MKNTSARLEPGTRYALQRFALKLVIIGTFALAQSWMPWGFGRALLALSLISAAIDVGLAMYFRERPSWRVMGYWDEAGAFTAIGVLVLAFLR